jgi:hypothetical protein
LPVSSSFTWAFGSHTSLPVHVRTGNPSSNVWLTLRLAYVGVSTFIWTEKNHHVPVLITFHSRMFTFLMALSFMCFSSRDQVVIIVLSIAWFALCALLFWWITVLYEGRSLSYLKPQWLTFRHLKDSIKGWIMVRKPKGTNMHSANNYTQSTL